MSTHLCVGLDHTGLWHSLHIAAYFGLLIDAGHLASAVHWWNMNNLFKQSNIFAAVESHKTHNEASVFLWYKIWYFMDLMLYLPSCDELEQFEGYSEIDLFVLCSVLWFCSIPAFCFLLYMKVFFLPPLLVSCVEIPLKHTPLVRHTSGLWKLFILNLFRPALFPFQAPNKAAACRQTAVWNILLGVHSAEIHQAHFCGWYWKKISLRIVKGQLSRQWSKSLF